MEKGSEYLPPKLELGAFKDTPYLPMWRYKSGVVNNKMKEILVAGGVYPEEFEEV